MKKTILCLALAACGGGGSGDDDDMMTMTPDASASEPTVNGKPASVYYAQFAHVTTKAEVGGAAAFPAQADGRNAYLAKFFLMPDSKLVLFYAEGEGTVSTTGYSLNVLRSTMKKREGTWKVEGAQLVLDQYMRCDGFTLNNKDALRCTLAASIVTSAAQGRTGTFQTGIGMSSPDDSEFADYVP